MRVFLTSSLGGAMTSSTCLNGHEVQADFDFCPRCGAAAEKRVDVPQSTRPKVVLPASWPSTQGQASSRWPMVAVAAGLAAVVAIIGLSAGSGGSSEHDATIRLHYNNLSKCLAYPSSVTVYDESGKNLGALTSGDLGCKVDPGEPYGRGVTFNGTLPLPKAEQYVIEISGAGLSIGDETLPAVSYSEAESNDWVLP